jgi:hypothetical protein
MDFIVTKPVKIISPPLVYQYKTSTKKKNDYLYKKPQVKFTYHLIRLGIFYQNNVLFVNNKKIQREQSV